MEEIDLKEIFYIFWNKKVLILAVVIVFIGIGVVYSKYFVKPDYEAKSTLVLTKNTSSDDATITQSEVTLNQKLVATYTEVVKSTKVLRQVISNLGINITEEELKENVKVSLVSNSQLIQVAVTNENPETAKNLANEITSVFIEKVKEIYKIDNINVVDLAKIPEAPYNINHKKDIIMFAVAGFAIALVYVFVSSLLDTTIKTAEEAEKRLQLNVLASIPNYNMMQKKKGKK